MRTLVFATGSAGDILPFATLARALRERGHDVMAFANERFGDMFGDGISFTSTSTRAEYDEVVGNPLLWHPMKGPAMVTQYNMGPGFERTSALVREHAGEDTVVVCHPFSFGASLMAEKLGRPVVRLVGMPSLFVGPHGLPTSPRVKRSDHRPLWWRRFVFRLIDGLAMKRFLGGPLNERRAELGLTPITSRFMDYITWGHTALCLFPEWFAAPTPDWPEHARQVGFFLDRFAPESQLSVELQAFLDAGDPPIIFTPGPAGFLHRSDFFAMAAKVCDRLGRRGLFVTRGLEVDVVLPDSVLTAAFAPFTELFHRAALIVHHGGVGTTAHALASGRPQIITPFGFDQPDHAWRIEKLGVGNWMLPLRGSVDELAEKADGLLRSEQVANNCRDLAAQLRGSGAEAVRAACEAVEASLA